MNVPFHFLLADELGLAGLLSAGPRITKNGHPGQFLPE